MIIIKPVSVLRSMVPQYTDIVLFDNNIEKMKGFSQKDGCRMSNSENNYIIVKSFRGDESDTELKYGVGKGCTQLFSRIEEFQKQNI